MISIKNIVPIVILYCQSKGFTINPLKLQKLLYFIQAWHIVFFKKNPLWDELPEAWVNGPVYRSVYDIFKAKFYRNSNILYRGNEESLLDELAKRTRMSELTDEQQKLLFSVLDVYGAMSDEKLVISTHSATPWNKAREGFSLLERCSKCISVEDMYDYYSKPKK